MPSIQVDRCWNLHSNIYERMGGLESNRKYLERFNGISFSFFINVIPYIIMRTEHYTVLGFVSGLIPTFIILHWAWNRLPDETKVYGWT